MRYSREFRSLIRDPLGFFLFGFNPSLFRRFGFFLPVNFPALTGVLPNSFPSPKDAASHRTAHATLDQTVELFRPPSLLRVANNALGLDRDGFLRGFCYPFGADTLGSADCAALKRGQKPRFNSFAFRNSCNDLGFECGVVPHDLKKLGGKDRVQRTANGTTNKGRTGG